MRVRSYEFYEVRTSLLGIEPTVHCRGSEKICREKMGKMRESHLEANNGNLYLVRVQLIEAIKADKQ